MATEHTHIRREELEANGDVTVHFGGLQEIVRFAIQKEQEAIDFYTGIAARMKPESLAEELRKIAAMEVQHRERLERLDLATFVATPHKKAMDLKIADYLVAPEPTPGMTWQDILNVAMHRELASMKLYDDLAKLVDEPAAQSLFHNLAAEESNHKLFFERIWDEEVLLEN